VGVLRKDKKTISYVTLDPKLTLGYENILTIEKDDSVTLKKHIKKYKHISVFFFVIFLVLIKKK